MRNLITKYSLILHHRNQQFVKYRSNCKNRKMENSHMIIQIHAVLKKVSSQQNTNFLNHDILYSHLFFNGLFLSDASPLHHNLNFNLLSLSSKILAMSCFYTGIFPHF